jgi:protein gp37
MAENSHISWTDHTFNAWIGCTRVSPGCVNCYAEEMMANRYGRVVWGPKGKRSPTSDEYWKQPLAWNKRAAKAGVRMRVFCSSLADMMDNHPSILPAWRTRLWETIAQTQNLDWLLLTKRPENWSKFMPVHECRPPYENVMLGITMENQAAVDDRWHWMQEAHGLCGFSTFISYEPALGPVDWSILESGACDWLICGGESGKNARPMHPNWARAARDACKQFDVPFHFKQWGEWAPYMVIPGGDLGGDMRRGSVVQVNLDRAPDGHFKRGDAYMKRVGKKRAGRSLDGVEHNGFPRPL